MKVEVRARLVTRSMSIAAPVPMAVADPVAMTPVQMAVAHQAAMPAVMPMAVAAMHLNQQVAFGCGFRNGGLRCDGRRGDRSEQGSHSNNGCCQGHLRQHGFFSPRFGSSGASIRAHLCMSSLNSTATVGSSGIHPASLLPGKKPVAFRRCSQVFLRVATKSRQGARPSALTPPANTSI